MRLPSFIRRLVRRHTTKPKNVKVAELMVKRKSLSLVYALISWNLMGLVVYRLYKYQKETNSKNLTGGRYYADLFDTKNVTLIRFEGLTKVGQWDLDEEKKQFGRLLTNEDEKDIESGKLTVDESTHKYKLQEKFQDLEALYSKE